MFKYTSLKKGKAGSLLDSTKHIAGHFIVAQQTKDAYRFDHFKTHTEFIRARESLPASDTYHEVIQQEGKPFFDIDIPITPKTPKNIDEAVRTEIVRAIYYMFKKLYSYKLSSSKNIIITGGSSADKHSMHIVIDGYRHMNRDEARYFSLEVVKEMIEEYRKYVDVGVYSSCHNLRLLFETKQGTQRMKSFVSEWKYKDSVRAWSPPEQPVSDVHLRIMQFAAATVTCNLSLCIALPLVVPPKSEKTCKNEKELLTPEVDNAIKLYTLSDCVLDSVMGRIIKLKRVSHGLCITCGTVHESENPYLYISADGSVWFNCRRSDNRIYLGVVDTTSIDEDVKPIVEPSSIIEDEPSSIIEDEDENEDEITALRLAMLNKYKLKNNKPMLYELKPLSGPNRLTIMEDLIRNIKYK